MSAEPFSSLELEASSERRQTTENVAGYLAAISIFASLIALAWHPLRLLGPSLLIALISAGMTGRGKRLAVRGRPDRRRLLLRRHGDLGRHRARTLVTAPPLLQRSCCGWAEHGLRGPAPRAVPRQSLRRPAGMARAVRGRAPELLATQPGLAALLDRNGHAAVAAAPRCHRACGRRASSSGPSPPRWRSSRPSARTATSPPARPARLRAARRPGARAGAPRRRSRPSCMARIPAYAARACTSPGETLADALPHLRETYCGTIAYEIEHISDHEERVWLRQAIESGRYRAAARRRGARARCSRASVEVEGMEQLPAPRVPRPEAVLDRGPRRDGADARRGDRARGRRPARTRSSIGMAHRGRLNVLAHVVGRPYEVDPARVRGRADDRGRRLERRGRHRRREVPPRRRRRRARRRRARSRSRSRPTRATSRRSTRWSRAAPAPSRPTARRATATTTRRSRCRSSSTATRRSPARAWSRRRSTSQGLVGYSTGGTLHLIANNQVGFTTDPEDGRSTRYSSDLAKGFDIPIVHVNADDPEAAISAVRLALAYRRRFGHDVVVDLVGYRRYGHNEQDEPAYTQPLLAAAIAAHPTVRELFAAQLVARGRRHRRSRPTSWPPRWPAS